MNMPRGSDLMTFEQFCETKRWVWNINNAVNDDWVDPACQGWLFMDDTLYLIHNFEQEYVLVIGNCVYDGTFEEMAYKLYEFAGSEGFLTPTSGKIITHRDHDAELRVRVQKEGINSPWVVIEDRCDTEEWTGKVLVWPANVGELVEELKRAEKLANELEDR